MFTEDSGIFARFKNFFSADEKSTEDVVVEETTTELQVTETVNSLQILEETPMPERTSMVSDESVTEKEIPLRTVEVRLQKFLCPTKKTLTFVLPPSLFQRAVNLFTAKTCNKR